LARPIDELQALSPALVVAALAACVRGDAGAAGGFLEEFTEVTRDAAMEWRMSQLAEIVRLSLWAGRGDLAADLMAGAEDRATLPGGSAYMFGRWARSAGVGSDLAFRPMRSGRADRHTAIPGGIPRTGYRWEVTEALSTTAAEIATLRTKLDRTVALSLAVFM